MKDNTQISLRALEPEDLDILYRIENDIKMWNVGVTNVPYSKFVLHDYIANNHCDIYTDRELRMMIESSDNQVVGIVDIINFDPRNLKAEIGIVIKQDFRRCGYATAAILQLKQYCKTVLNLHQLFVIIDANNLSSLALFKKCGFAFTATLNDWFLQDGKYGNAQVLQLFL